MKKFLLAFIMAGALVGCGGASTAQVASPDAAVLKTYELQQQSNTERIEKLEKELSATKESLATMQRQSKQLGESYDGLLSLFNEQKKVMIGLMSTLNRAFAPTEKEDKK